MELDVVRLVDQPLMSRGISTPSKTLLPIGVGSLSPRSPAYSPPLTSLKVLKHPSPTPISVSTSSVPLVDLTVVLELIHWSSAHSEPSHPRDYDWAAGTVTPCVAPVFSMAPITTVLVVLAVPSPLESPSLGVGS